MAAIAVNYVILVPPTQLWLWIRKRKRDLAWLGYYYFEVFLRLFGVKPEVRGQENIPKGRSYILLSNHQSFIDIGFLINAMCPLAFLAKKELFTTPFFGNSLKFMGCIPIDRGNRTANLELPKTLHSRICDEHYNYCVFPEGTRSPDGQLLQFKNGIFKIIKEAPVLVLPVTIDGSGKVMPKKGLALFPRRARITIHAPIEPAQIEQMTAEALRDQVKATIGSGFEPPQGK